MVDLEMVEFTQCHSMVAVTKPSENPVDIRSSNRFYRDYRPTDDMATAAITMLPTSISRT